MCVRDDGGWRWRSHEQRELGEVEWNERKELGQIQELNAKEESGVMEE